MHLTRRAGLKGIAASIALPVFAVAGERDIVIGAPNALSGVFAEIGSGGLRGMQMALNEINRAGGIAALRGAQLKLVAADTTSDDPAQAANVTRRLIDQERPVALLGAGSGTMTLAAQAEAERSEIPLITNALADGIVSRGYRYTFKIAPQGGGLWPWTMSNAVAVWTAIKGRPPRAALMVMSNDAVGAVLHKALPEHAKTLGLAASASPLFQTGLSDASLLVATAQRSRPDLIFLGGFPADIVVIVKALRSAGVSAPIFSAGLAGTDAIRKGLGSAADRLFSPMAWNWDLAVPGNKELVAAYKSAYADQPYPPANEQIGQGYAIAMILRQALEASASLDPKALRDAIAATEFTGMPLPKPTVRFGTQGLNAYNTAVLAEWIKGELRTVWPRELQTTQPML